ncbi:MAG TPA: hypothetical protein GXX69_07370, partial [Firmicutes bacterium]|nr:hypothetical protein [Bacillota bacterium]
AEGGCAVALLIFFTIAMLAGAYSVEAWATSILLSVGWMAIAWIRCKATQNKVNAVGATSPNYEQSAGAAEEQNTKSKGQNLLDLWMQTIIDSSLSSAALSAGMAVDESAIVSEHMFSQLFTEFWCYYVHINNRMAFEELGKARSIETMSALINAMGPSISQLGINDIKSVLSEQNIKIDSWTTVIEIDWLWELYNKRIGEYGSMPLMSAKTEDMLSTAAWALGEIVAEVLGCPGDVACIVVAMQSTSTRLGAVHAVFQEMLKIISQNS